MKLVFVVIEGLLVVAVKRHFLPQLRFGFYVRTAASNEYLGFLLIVDCN